MLWFVRQKFIEIAKVQKIESDSQQLVVETRKPEGL